MNKWLNPGSTLDSNDEFAKNGISRVSHKDRVTGCPLGICCCRPHSFCKTSLEGFICTFSLLISLSIALRTIKFRNLFTISSKYSELVSSDVILLNLKRDRTRIGLSFQVTHHLLRFSEMTSQLITFNHLRCYSSSTALGTRTGY